jgi:flagellar basal-body rod protein FlgB
MFSFEKILGVHENALRVYGQRAKVLASNISNTDTPNYKARDVDFKSILGASKLTRVKMDTSEPGDMKVSNGTGGTDLVYRIPLQPSLDGNTVDAHVESAAFGDNAIRYQATLDFLSRKFKGIVGALKGE